MSNHTIQRKVKGNRAGRSPSLAATRNGRLLGAYEMIGHAPSTWEIYGRDRYGRALSECFQDDQSLSAAGWALAWYPERGEILGPQYDGEVAAAFAAGAGIWRGAFIPPWERRRQR